MAKAGQRDGTEGTDRTDPTDPTDPSHPIDRSDRSDRSDPVDDGPDWPAPETVDPELARRERRKLVWVFLVLILLHVGFGLFLVFGGRGSGD